MTRKSIPYPLRGDDVLTHVRRPVHDCRMSSEQVPNRIPEITLGWRLRLSLGDITRDEIAEMMDVTPSTVSRWCADKGSPPKRPYILRWAMVTGVDEQWLEKGVYPDGGTPPSAAAVTRRKTLNARVPVAA